MQTLTDYRLRGVGRRPMSTTTARAVINACEPVRATGSASSTSAATAPATKARGGTGSDLAVGQRKRYHDGWIERTTAGVQVSGEVACRAYMAERKLRRAERSVSSIVKAGEVR